MKRGNCYSRWKSAFPLCWFTLKEKGERCIGWACCWTYLREWRGQRKHAGTANLLGSDADWRNDEPLKWNGDEVAQVMTCVSPSRQATHSCLCYASGVATLSVSSEHSSHKSVLYCDCHLWGRILSKGVGLLRRRFIQWSSDIQEPGLTLLFLNGSLNWTEVYFLWPQSISLFYSLFSSETMYMFSMDRFVRRQLY